MGSLQLTILDIEDDLVDWFQEESSRGVDHAGVHLGVGGKEECHTEGWTTLVFI